jgi:hypothetical protein
MGMLNRPVHGSDMDLADGLAGTPSGSLFSRIVGGGIAAVVFLLFGLRACMLRHATLPGRRGARGIELSGPAAISFGIALMAVGIFLHFHFVWAPSERLYRWGNVAKAGSLLVVIGGLGYMAWCILAGA